jgi:hypothetical protein
MDIQTRKLNLIQEVLRVQNEKLIEKLEKTLEDGKKNDYETSLKPMSIKEYNEGVDKSLDDVKHERVVDTNQLKDICKEWK